MKKFLLVLLAFVWCFNTSSAQTIGFKPDTTYGCAPLTINFTNLTTDTAGVSFIWIVWNTDIWPSEQDTFATTFHSSYVFKTSGYYQIELTATDSLGFYIGSEWAFIYVNGSAGYFDMSADTVCPADEFWVMYNGAHKQAVWNFGDGAIDTSWWGSVSHQYLNEGKYGITLYLETDCGWDTIIQSVVVDSSAKPNVQVESYNSILCPGDSTKVYSPSIQDSNKNYIWELGTGNFSTKQDPMVAFPDTGTYYVKLSVTNLCGNTATDSIMITVTDSVDWFSVWAGGSNSACPGQNAEFYSDVSGGYKSITWYFEDGDTAYGQQVYHAFADTGVFYGAVVAKNGCGDISTDTTWVIISNDTTNKPNAGFSYQDTICPGEKVYFQSWDWNAVQFAWNFGNGTTSNQQYPEIIYNNTGIYNVTLTVTNACGISSSETNTIFIGSSGNVNVNVQISYSADSICPGGSVSFNVDSSQNIWNVEWNFDDGTTSTNWEDQHFFDNPGIYNVMLIGYGNCGISDTDWVDIYVGNNAPVSGVEFGHFPDSACANDTIFFIDLGLFANGLDTSVTNTYSFDFGDGNTAVSNSLFNIFFLAGHAYTNTGTYNVSVKVVNECGGTATFYDTVKISSGIYPEAFFITNDFEFESDTLFKCPGDTIDFFGYGGLTYSWDFGDGNKSAVKNPVHLYQDTGYFKASLVVTNGCGLTDTTSVVINISGSNVPDINLNYDKSELCLGEPIWLESWGSGYTELVWDFGDGTFSYENNFEKWYDSPGSYLITLSASNLCGSFTDSVMVEVFERAVAIFTANPTILSNVKDTVFFENFSQNANEYVWDFGDGKGYSYDKNPYYVYGDSGVYEVKLLATNFANCNDETYSFVVVGADTNSNCDSFVVDMTADAFFVSAGDTVQFYDLSSDPLNTIIGWEWDFGDGSWSNEQNPVHVYGTAGFYTVNFYVVNSLGCLDSTFGFMIVAPEGGDTTGCSALVVDFEIDPATPNFMDTVNFTDLSVSSGFIIATLWNFGDSTSSMDTNPYHLFDTIGSYNVTLIVMDYNFCTDSISKTIVVSDTGVSIYEHPVESQFVIYPNPTTGKFVIDFKSVVQSVQPSKLVIYDVTGREVYSTKWNVGINHKELDLSVLNAGIYSVEFKTDYSTLQRSKLIISK